MNLRTKLEQTLPFTVGHSHRQATYTRVAWKPNKFVVNAVNHVAPHSLSLHGGTASSNPTLGSFGLSKNTRYSAILGERTNAFCPRFCPREEGKIVSKKGDQGRRASALAPTLARDPEPFIYWRKWLSPVAATETLQQCNARREVVMVVLLSRPSASASDLRPPSGIA